MTYSELKRLYELEAKVKLCSRRTTEEKAEYRQLRERRDEELGLRIESKGPFGRARKVGGVPSERKKDRQ